MDLVWVDPADYESAGSTFVVVQTENLIYIGKPCRSRGKRVAKLAP